MEVVVERENMARAYRGVVANRGAPGIDEMTVEHRLRSLRQHWSRIKEELLEGRYKPSPIRAVEIPKSGGGTRPLGIPTVVDRFVQQALHQVLVPIFVAPPWKRKFLGYSMTMHKMPRRSLPRNPCDGLSKPLRRYSVVDAEGARACTSARDGRGPWWNAGASHMHDAFRAGYFAQLGLVSLQQELRRLQRSS